MDTDDNSNSCEAALWGGMSSPLRQRYSDLSHHLVLGKQERVVSKDDLIKAIWNGRSVSDAALTTRLNAARSALGDSGEEQRLIKTLPRKGFRFVGTVREAAGSRQAGHPQPATR